MSSARFGSMIVVVVLALSVTALHAAEGGGSGLDYNKLGADWPGLCQTGLKQSPVNYPTKWLTPYDKPEYEPRFETLGTVVNTTLFSTATLPHVELTWEAMPSPMKVTLAADLKGDIFAPLRGYLGEGNMKRVAIEPAQFHFHCPSEESVDGKLYDGVIHIVNFVKDGESEFCDGLKAAGGLGCPAVIGIFLKEDESVESSPLSELFATDEKMLMYEAGKEKGNKRSVEFDLNTLLPNKGNIATLEGSLTTAPCTEGVFWNTLLTPLSISPKELRQLKDTVANVMAPDCKGVTKEGLCFPTRVPANNRVVQPRNERAMRISNAY